MFSWVEHLDTLHHPSFYTELQTTLSHCLSIAQIPRSLIQTTFVNELPKHCYRHTLAMGVTRTTTTHGTGPQPVRGQTVTIAYTGWIKDTSKPGNKGQE